MSELYILRFRERATYLEITHEELYTYCSLVKTSNKSLNPPIKSLYKHRMSVWPSSSSSPMYLGMFSWYLNVCFPHANIVLATTQVKESWAISFNRSVSHFSLYLISRLRDFQPKSLDICYFGDTHHAENERGWRWADTETLRLTQRAEEMLGDMFRPLNVSSVHCQKLKKQTRGCLVCPVFVATLPLPALAQICQSFLFPRHITWVVSSCLKLGDWQAALTIHVEQN